MKRIGFAVLIVLPLAPSSAWAGAEGVYPSTLFCERLPFESGPIRDGLTVTVSGGRASYSRPLRTPDPVGTAETGSGALSGENLTLTGRARGKGFSYEARYSGALNGRGGLLTGEQTWTHGGKAYRRACQMTLGNGRY